MAKGGYSGGSTIVHKGSGWHSPKRKTARKSVRRVEEVVFSHEPVAEESVFDDPMWRAALRDAHRAARQVNEGEE